MDPFVIWCAGFFDGEGSISIPRARRKNCAGLLTANQMWLQVTVTQNQTAPLFTLKERFGGRVTLMSQPHQKVLGRPVWRWIANSENALNFLQAVRPFLRIKGAAADVAIEFQSRIRRNNGGHPGDVEVIFAERLASKEKLERINREAHAI